MSGRSVWLALLGGIGLALAMSPSAFAYNTVVPHTIIVTPSSGTFLCGEFHLVRATVLDEQGQPIEGLTVTWSFASSPSSHDKIETTSSQTDAQGVAKTRVELACVLGDREIRATTDGISGSAIVHVSGDQQHVLGTTGTPGLPNTSTLPASAPADGSPIPAIPAMVALLVATAIVLRRFALLRS